jgi:hypothetical protein
MFTYFSGRRKQMKINLIVCLVAALLMMPGAAVAGMVTDEDFKAATTRNLVNLCSATAEDPKGKEAIHFCHGYLTGALDYYESSYSGPESNPLVCFSNSPVSRNMMVKMFTEWATAHPQYMDEKPVDTQFRFLMEKWPCK